MAKLIVMIDIPNYDYAELREMMEKGLESTIPGIAFGGATSFVLVHERYLGPRHEGNYRCFKLIGVRP